MSGRPAATGTAAPARRGLDLALEVAIALLSLATIAGFARLFDDGRFFWQLAVPTLVAHGLAAATRRLGLGLLLSGLVSVVGFVVTMGLVLHPDTLWFGLPTGATRDAVVADLEAAWQLFDEVGPPAPVLPGYVLVAATALWLAAFLADWAAFRLQSVVETILPCGAIFLFGTIYTKDHHREVAAGLELAAVLLLVLVHRVRSRSAGTTWLGSQARGSGALLRAGAVVGVLAVGAGAVVGPELPGADAQPVIAWRELKDRDDARVTVSPLVDIQASLVDQPDSVVFTVRAPEPDYWRLTSLDRFDGRVWESSGRFDDADGELPSTLPPDVAVRTLEQTFTIRSLGDFWLPAAYEPAAVTAPGGTEPVYEAASGTLVVGQDVESADGRTYTVLSRVPIRDLAAVEAGGGPLPDDIADRYLGLPDGLDPVVAATAAEVTAGATTPYTQALALQNWFRANFTYDLEVAAGHSIDGITAFLAVRRGYCEQFAGTYAAMARTLGLPARVAVGFTPGDRAGDTFTVRGEHAHAWPEVWIAGVGWLRFEPTPGRGAPGDTAYTGVAPSQAAPGDGATAVPVPTPTTLAPTPGTGPATGDPSLPGDVGLPLDQPSTAPTDDGADGSTWAAALGLVVALAVAWVVGVPSARALRRRRARRRARDARARVHLAWQELVEDLQASGLGRAPAETALEHADRVAVSVPDGGRLLTVAHAVTGAAFAPQPPSPEEEHGVVATAAALRTDVRRNRTPAQRLRAALDPRTLLPGPGRSGWTDAPTERVTPRRRA